MTEEFKAHAAKRKSQKLTYRNPMPINDALTNTAKLSNAVMDQPHPLYTELVPKTCWLSNVRDHLTTKEWSEVKDWCYKRSQYRCEICGETGIGQRSRKWNVEAHEVWHYDESDLSQTLIGLVSLCPACHECKHYGRALAIGIDAKVRYRLKIINKWTWAQVYEHCEESVATYVKRSMHNWTLNLDYLKEEFGLNVQIHRVPIILEDEVVQTLKTMNWRNE